MFLVLREYNLFSQVKLFIVKKYLNKNILITFKYIRTSIEAIYWCFLVVDRLKLCYYIVYLLKFYFAEGGSNRGSLQLHPSLQFRFGERENSIMDQGTGNVDVKIVSRAAGKCCATLFIHGSWNDKSQKTAVVTLLAQDTST